MLGTVSRDQRMLEKNECVKVHACARTTSARAIFVGYNPNLSTY